MQNGEKVFIKTTKQVGKFIRETHGGIRADVEIQTINGPKIVNVLKAILVAIEIARTAWPLIRDVIDYFRGKPKTRIIFKEKDIEI